jgi:hypothetical protein
MIAASEIPPPVNCEINLGKTGMIIPKPIISMSIVMKIKPSAAFLLTDIFRRIEFLKICVF